MKVFLLLMTLLLSTSAFAQEFTKKEQQTLKKFNIDPVAQNYDNEVKYDELHSFLNTDKQYRRKKKWGFIFAGAGTLLTTTGILLFTQRDGSVDTYPLEDLAGGASIILGGACLGATFPIFNSSKKLKNKKEDLLEKTKA